ncbi:prepilin-type N-terminal cleavage/methylation domain-containing protein [Clostridium estertheticum]|uniref:type IV pilus modification PilV family protein n=1 Tax=Clostridium estertheticum TaxID=238834 RepID=UPI0013E987F8|nr:prepilin-type N-terminal cleavage/methylation domain-containing protein [Clostridium estertheticum]MBZ9688021.1 prepilin-type N-terminal cleavage/methylation domain-containing protein [Clostridium estertheticum]
MSKSINKKGFTMLEVLCSLGIFSIIFICMMSFDVTSHNIKKDIKTINNNVTLMECLKNNIIYSMTFEELEELKKNNRVFVNSENMYVNKIQIGVMDLFSDKAILTDSYIQLNFLKCEFKVYTLRLTLHSGSPEELIELQCNFYKGDHK